MKKVNAFTMIIGVTVFAGAFVIAMWVIRDLMKVLHRIIGNLRENSAQVAGAAGHISSSSQSLAEGATEQAAGLEETSSSLEEMAAMTKQNSDNAQQANSLMAEAASPLVR